MKPLCLVLILALSLPACSRFSESSRRQHAYEKYIRKSSVLRTRQQSRFARSRAPKIPPPQPVSEPQINAQTSEGPQSVPREQADQ